MKRFLRSVIKDEAFQASPLISLSAKLRPLYDSRFTIWFLLILGFIRAIVFVIAYPPARGADAGDYFLYAAQFEGLDAPTVFGLIYPLYPILIYLSHYVLGSIYVLIALQLVMSATISLFYYVGVRQYSPVLALLIALLVIGDAQTGILFNFTSTEPLYMYLLSAAFGLFLLQIRRSSAQRWYWMDALVGIVLATTLLARPVGRYLIIPFAVLFGLSLWARERSFWLNHAIRTGVIVVSYVGVLIVFATFNNYMFQKFEVNGSGSLMLTVPLNRSGLLEESNGPASARVIELREACPDDEIRNRCLVQQTGDWKEVQRLYSRAFREMITAHTMDYAELVFQDFNEFLRETGLQYQGPVTPSDVQCGDVNAITDINTAFYIEEDPLFVNSSGVTFENLRPIVYDINAAMCPPWPDNNNVRKWVDKIAFHYRSVARPHPYVWYALLGLLLLIPWARRFWPLALLAGAIVVNHAVLSAALLNVQPRYVAMTNAYKGILVLLVLFLVGELILRVADRWLSQREQTSQMVQIDD